MAFTFSGQELIDMVIMTVAAGYIFMDFFKQESTGDPVLDLQRQSSFKDRLLYSMALVAPAILLHELGHKFVGAAYGLTAEFHAAYTWLGIGVLLKLVSFPFLIIVPAYVRIIGQATPTESLLIAFAGPAVNIVLWLLAYGVLKTREFSAGWRRFWNYTLYINGFLAVFNLLPIPGFDGHTVWSNLFGLL